MKKILHKANTRGHADHGWLNSYHSFSFATYYNPERMNFGVLRVLNDDMVSGGQGFGTHPHKNMEIISIPLEGDLEHKDSLGNTVVINEGDVQVMSAGTGVYHSEYNKNKDKTVKFLQIWILPNKENVTPRFDQISLRELEKKNEFYQILSPKKEDNGVWIYQDAYFYLGKFDHIKKGSYSLNTKKNGVYIFVIQGSFKVGDQLLEKRDGLGIMEADSFSFEAFPDTEVLLMEVPLTIT